MKKIEIKVRILRIGGSLGLSSKRTGGTFPLKLSISQAKNKVGATYNF